VDTSRPHPARVYDWVLGGKDNFAADRALGEQLVQAIPSMPSGARDNRAFLRRAVRYLVAEAGVRQFLDIGTGIPTAGNTHEVAQELAPESRVVYVDNDPLVFAHSRALLISAPQGRTNYVLADLRDPEAILTAKAVTQTLDLSQPVALMLVAVLHHLTDEDRPYDHVRTLVDALPAGSWLVLSHGTSDFITPEQAAAAAAVAARTGMAWPTRSRAQVQRFFDGLELVDPGIVSVRQWGPSVGPADPAGSGHWAGVAQKPR